MKFWREGFFSRMAAAMLVVLVCFVAGCGGEAPKKEEKQASEKFEIVDLAGRTVGFERPAKKAVVQWSGSGGGFLTIAALTGKDMTNVIVGMDNGLQEYRADMWNQYKSDIPELEKIEIIGNVDNNTFNTEKVIALKPDVAFFPLDLKKSVEGDIAPKLEQAGIKVVYTDYHAEVLERHQQTLQIMGKILGKEERAKEISDFYTKKVTAVYDRVKKLEGKKKPTMYIEIGMTGPEKYGNSQGKDYMWGKIATMVGGDLITAGVIEKAEPINPELLMEKNPDIILINGSYWPKNPTSMRLGFEANEEESQKLLAAFTTREGWQQLKAVQNKQVYSLHHGVAREPYDYASIEFMAKILYPEEFKDLDPAASLKEFYEKFLPFTYKGLWYLRLK